MKDEHDTAAAREFVEILTRRAQRSGVSPGRALNQHRQNLASLAKLTSVVRLQAVLSELDSQTAKLELERNS
ncbi:hypothetical protein [Methylobacterium sp. CM6257]|jgi:hypothetical protein